MRFVCSFVVLCGGVLSDLEYRGTGARTDEKLPRYWVYRVAFTSRDGLNQLVEYRQVRGCIVLIHLDNQQTSPSLSAKSWPLLYPGFNSSKRPSCRGGAFLPTSLEEGHKMTRVVSSDCQRTPIPPGKSPLSFRSPQDGSCVS